MCEECDAAMPAKDIPQQVSVPLASKTLELCDAVENKGDLPLNKWALKTGRLVNEVRDLAEALASAHAPAQQATDGGRNPRYEGLFDGETEEQRASRLAPVQAVSAQPAGGFDPDMALPCDIKLPGGMQISKGCKLSTLLISFRNRGDDVPWRQRFSVPVPYDPALLSINPAPAKDGLAAVLDRMAAQMLTTGTAAFETQATDDGITVRMVPEADLQPTGIDSEGGSHD